MSEKLEVGVGRTIITPPIGTILYGYAPGRPAQSINDDLRVTCIALEYDNTKAMLISADICTFSTDSCSRLRNLISDETGIASENIIFCSTHTHSGPATSAAAGWGVLNNGYIQDILEPQVICAAKIASADLRPALFGVGATNSDVGINRRQLNRDGSVSLGQNPWGLYDPEMTILSLKTPDGKPLVNIVHYGCHGTASGNNPEVTRDWSGYMVDCLEEQSGAITVFFNGAIGDTGPRLPNGKTTGNLKLAMELGARAGSDAVKTWRGIKEYRDAPVKRINQELKLPYQPLPDLATAQAELDRLGQPEKLVGMSMKQYHKWQLVINEYTSGQPLQTHFSFNQTIIAIGSVAFVPFPFEFFAEIGMRLRQHSPFQHTLCLSNANGSFAYFPTQDQYSRGGYEITVARNFNTYALAEDADNYAVDGNLRLLDALGKFRADR